MNLRCSTGGCIGYSTPGVDGAVLCLLGKTFKYDFHAFCASNVFGFAGSGASTVHCANAVL